MTAPALDHDLSLLQRIEDLPVQELVAQASVETLDIAVLPWTSWGDVGRLGANGANPLPYGLGDELLDGEMFYSLKEAQIVIESWRRHYNAVRPHESLGYPLSLGLLAHDATSLKAFR